MTKFIDSVNEKHLKEAVECVEDDPVADEQVLEEAAENLIWQIW